MARRGISVVGSAFIAAACGGTVTEVGDPERPKAPVQHRARAEPCNAAPPGDVAQGPSIPCFSDAECVDGPGGRCTPSGGPGSCVYQFCTVDADCGAGNGVCECAASGYGNRCLVGECAVDADCPGSYCSPSFGDCGNYTGNVGYFCHTAQDECVDDADCGGGMAYCMYSPAAGHWLCSDSHCVG